MRNLMLILLVEWFSCFAANANNYISVKNIGLEQGLSNGYVHDIAIDSNGFVWVATENGLNRISGNRCTNMLWKPEIFGNKTLTCLYYEHSEDKLWIGSHRGIAVYDFQTQQFMKLGQNEGIIARDVASISKASDSGIWITYANGIIQHYSVKKKLFTNYDYCKLTGKKGPLAYSTDDGKGMLYICTSDEGFVTLNMNTRKYKQYVHHADSVHSIPGNQTRYAFVDHNKHIWIGTKNGLSLFDPHSESFTNYRHIPNDERSLCGDNIFTITEMNNRYLWITSDLGGISILDLETVKVSDPQHIEFINLTDENSDVTSSSVRTVKQDPFGNVWVGCYGSGIDFIDASPFTFHIFPYYKSGSQAQELKRIYGIKIDHNGHMWLGGENEVSEFADGKLMHAWKTDRFQSVINTIEIDHRGHVWMGMNDVGIICLSPQTGQFYKVGQGFEKNDIHALYEDDGGKMWIGFDIGLFSFENGQVREETKYNEQMDTRSIYALAFDKNHSLWVGTGERGLYVFDRNGKMTAHLMHTNGFPSSSINHIYIDKDDGIWIATYSGLVYIPDCKTPEKYTIFSTESGLKDSHIRAIQQDLDGNIWVSTYTNIACLNINKHKFYNYDYNNHTPRGSFVEGGTARNNDGTIYFTSSQGVCFFNPLNMNDSKSISPVHILSAKSLLPSTEKDSIVIFVHDNNGSINLSYDQNTFSLQFTIENYSQIADAEYRYQMKGLDEKWYDTDGADEMTFRNLPPGKYTFTIRAKLKNQDWEDATEDQMAIIISPPIWLSWWAKMLYILITIGVIAYYFYSYQRKLQLKNSLLLAQRESIQKEELHEDRLRFFTNITHELRTPLTLIVGPLQDLLDDDRMPDIYHRKLETINKSAARLQNLINDILEFRKTETQNRKLSVAKEDLKSIVKAIGNHFKELNRNPQVGFSIKVNPLVPATYFDSEVIETILSNLLSNAMKYTPSGEIVLDMDMEGRKVKISVSDTGYGIAPEALPHIFDRYYQAKGEHQASGTGIGLALAKSLADLHKAELNVQSTLGKGTVFTFVLDTDETYPNALHKEDKEKSEYMQMKTADSENGDTDNNEDQLPLLLVVEDNDEIRQYIAESMNEDYRICLTKNGREGVNAAVECIPDIIVSDVMMPEMNGIILTKKLKEDIRTSHIPIILLTAKDSMEAKEEGYTSGADSYLTKPFSARLLNSRIQNLLNSRRRLAERIIMQSTGKDETINTGKRKEENKSIPILSKLDQDFMKKLNLLIIDNIVKEDLDMAFMTDKMAMSHSTFYRKVKALTGMTAVEYIRKIKLKHSMQLLQSGDYTVTEAAMMAGFNNQGHFRDSFKKEFGLNPSDVLKSGNKQ